MDSAQWGVRDRETNRRREGPGGYLVQTTDLSTRYSELTLNDTRTMVVQPYIEHSEKGCPTSYRVLTLFGRVLYSARNRWAVARQQLEEIAANPNGIIASNDGSFGRLRTVWNDAEIIALGERAASAFPECPVLGVDVVRDLDTNKLYVLEVNPAGRVWHFSSPLAMNRFTAEYRADLYAQFGALDRIAELLIDRDSERSNLERIPVTWKRSLHVGSNWCILAG